MATSIRTPEQSTGSLKSGAIGFGQEHGGFGLSDQQRNSLNRNRALIIASPKEDKGIVEKAKALFNKSVLISMGAVALGGIVVAEQASSARSDYSRDELRQLPSETVTVRMGEGADAAIIAADQEELLSGAYPNERVAVEDVVGEQLAHGNVAEVPIIPGINQEG